MPDQNIATLIDRLLNGSITPAEKEFLAKWIAYDSDEKELHSMMERAWSDFKPGQNLPAEKAGQLLESILHRAKENDTAQPKAIHGDRIGWRPSIRAYQWAAAVLLFVIVTGVGFYFLRKQPGAIPTAIARRDVLPPAASNAVLTLANGQTIVLDSAGKGNIAIQRTTAIIKQGDGDIAYRTTGKTDDIEYNTLTVPRGSRIAHVTLSDGTRVWLNAGSSLRYPVSFNGQDRQVSVTGESYFEVAQDKAHPFVVSKGNCAIKVLGTHFNVNAYDEEEKIKVTLLEGSVKVISGAGNNLLLPGQMAVMNAGQKMEILENADIERVMAWKNGYFNFANADIRTVLRELSRWYDLELVFDDVTNEKFHVEIRRDIPLSKVLSILEMTDKVHFNISGKKVTVTH
ncbi:FecR domain-containing protein [Flavitalea sp. BT771]|uniref:FecR family protein n=1 Tax=Flavitalea sp. BT771 TaxID=3063329 RepID=UPI0026E13EE8|nr:FecR family protein [Flavitalea sp. BT771]MDO6429054.1 FecR domain-containing protein [Flavitalea sp. BT771]MDV6218818.1 FecR domain-containing protein [Flavitalea sp. BT771]